MGKTGTDPGFSAKNLPKAYSLALKLKMKAHAPRVDAGLLST